MMPEGLWECVGGVGEDTGLPESWRVKPQGLCNHHVQVGQVFLEAAVVRSRLWRGRGKERKLSYTESYSILASPLALESRSNSADSKVGTPQSAKSIESTLLWVSAVHVPLYLFHGAVY